MATSAFSSGVGQGTTFHFEIALPVDSIAEKRPTADGRTVSLIAPEDMATISTEISLEAAGFTVVAGNNAPRSAAGSHLVLLHPAAAEAVPRSGAGEFPPVVLIRPHGEDRHVALAQTPVGELPVPLGRADVDRLCSALAAHDFTVLNTHAGMQRSAEVLPDYSGISVLAVDDNAVNREVLKEALTALGVQASFAASGEEAIQLYGRDRYDLIFMDCSMPGMDGYEATRQIRGLQGGGSRPHIVALTAHVTGSAARLWRNAGMDSYVAKPFTIEQLAREFASVCGSDPVASAPSNEHSRNGSAPADFSVVPLISPDTLEMFKAIAEANGADMSERVFSMFHEHAPVAEAGLRDAIAGGDDPDNIAAQIHALKSMCSSAGAARAAAVCQEMEDKAKDGTVPTKEELAVLSDAIAATRAEMDSLPPLLNGVSSDLVQQA
jgi:two-component system sensor histidine kinase BarA